MRIIFTDLLHIKDSNQITWGNLHINVLFTVNFTITWVFQYSDFFSSSFFLFLIFLSSLLSFLVRELGSVRNPDPHSALLLKWPVTYSANSSYLHYSVLRSPIWLDLSIEMLTIYFFFFSSSFSFSIISSFPSPPPPSLALSLYSDTSIHLGFYASVLSLLSVLHSLTSV